MAGLHGSFSSSSKSNGGLTALMSSHEEFQEEEVWGLMPTGSKLRKSKSGPSWRRSASAGPIPRSAPASSRPPPSKSVDFPDWARILKEEEKPKKQWWDDDVDGCRHDDDGFFLGRKSHGVNDDDDDDDDDDEMLPPHELLARRHRKNRAAYSMCEGIGRTLKGRDLRTVRNSILAKTGFIENM